ncbi:unnamed protein product [Dibothriocephalus latus]|uniref:Uncharacterized protein n=1 Tax=Dibothriocephalus latus TaxID=60516 RepID=A0A3P7MK23_DIBLA|nr:unnamed protein product [Dibothriocephalus latus]
MLPCASCCWRRTIPSSPSRCRGGMVASPWLTAPNDGRNCVWDRLTLDPRSLTARRRRSFERSNAHTHKRPRPHPRLSVHYVCT